MTTTGRARSRSGTAATTGGTRTRGGRAESTPSAPRRLCSFSSCGSATATATMPITATFATAQEAQWTAARHLRRRGVARRISVTPATFLSGPGGESATSTTAADPQPDFPAAAPVFRRPIGPACELVQHARRHGCSGERNGTLSQRPTRSWHGTPSGRGRCLPASIRCRRRNTPRERPGERIRAIQLCGDEYRRETRTMRRRAGADTSPVRTGPDQSHGTAPAYWWRPGRLLEDHGSSNNTFGTTLVNTYPDRSRTSANAKLSAVYQLTGETAVRASAGTAFRNPTL